MLRSLLIAVTLLADAAAADAMPTQRLLARGVDVPKLGIIERPTLGYGSDSDSGSTYRACLGPDGTVVTKAQAQGERNGLVCVDASGPRAIVLAGDPAPEGGFFSSFYRCQVTGPQEVMFSAHRRFVLNEEAGEEAVYRAGPQGIERVVGITDLYSDHLGQLFNHSGTPAA